MPYGEAKTGSALVADSEQGDFVIEIDEALDYNLAAPGAPSFLRIMPTLLDVGNLAHDTLPLARRTHNRFHHAGATYLGYGCPVVLLTGSKAVGRSFKAQFLRGQAADTLAVHRQSGRAGGGDDVEALGFQFDKCIGGDGFDLWYHQVGFFRLYNLPQGRAVKHADGVRAVGYLHSGGIFIAVDGYDFDAEALQFDNDFLA